MGGATLKSSASLLRFFTVSSFATAVRLPFVSASSSRAADLWSSFVDLRTIVTLLYVLVAAFAAGHLFLRTPDVDATQNLPIVALLALAPVAWLLSRPLSLRRQRLALVGDIEAPRDPRRGLEIVATCLVEVFQNMAGLADLLNIRHLIVFPPTRYQRRYGPMVVSLSGSGHRRRDVAALAQALPEFLSVVELGIAVENGSLLGRPATPVRPQSLCERVAELSGTLRCRCLFPTG